MVKVAEGVDTSHWTYPTDWSHWSNLGFIFGYIKATEGTTWVDWRWKQHYAEATNFYKGPYHYFRAQWNGALQAQHMFETTKSVEWSMPPVIDVEKTNNTGFSRAVFAARLRNCLVETERLWGRRPMIYTSRSMWNTLVGSTVWASAYDLWIAHYTTYPVPLIPNDWKGAGYRMWQYTSRPMDLNRFDGDKAKFLEWIGQSPEPEPDPDPGEEPTILTPGLYRVKGV